MGVIKYLPSSKTNSGAYQAGKIRESFAMISARCSVINFRRFHSSLSEKNEFDQKYVREQRELMKAVYESVKILRLAI
jgi:hypothetical protein